MPIRSALRSSNGRNSSLTSPLGRPPHSSWTSMSTRSALAPTLSVRVVPGRVNLKAFCRRFATTAASTCLSAAIARAWSTGVTVSLTPRAFASNVDAKGVPG